MISVKDVLRYGNYLTDESFVTRSYNDIRLLIVLYESKIYKIKKVNGDIVEFVELNERG